MTQDLTVKISLKWHMPFCWQKLKIIRPESQPDLCRLVGSALIYPSWKSDVWQHTAGRKLVHLQHTQAALEGAVLLQQGPCTNFSLPYSIWPKLHLHPLYEEMAKFILRDRQFSSALDKYLFAWTLPRDCQCKTFSRWALLTPYLHLHQVSKENP